LASAPPLGALLLGGAGHRSLLAQTVWRRPGSQRRRRASCARGLPGYGSAHANRPPTSGRTAA